MPKVSQDHSLKFFYVFLDFSFSCFLNFNFDELLFFEFSIGHKLSRQMPLVKWQSLHETDQDHSTCCKFCFQFSFRFWSWFSLKFWFRLYLISASVLYVYTLQLNWLPAVRLYSVVHFLVLVQFSFTLDEPYRSI